MKSLIAASLLGIIMVFCLVPFGCRKTRILIFNFTYPESPLVGTPVLFTPDKTIPTGSKLNWDFGDSATSSDYAPAHVYAKSGDIYVSLTINNDTNHAVFKRIYIFDTTAYGMLIGNHLFHHNKEVPDIHPTIHTVTYYFADTNIPIVYIDPISISVSGTILKCQNQGSPVLLFSCWTGPISDRKELYFYPNTGKINYSVYTHVSAAAGDESDNYDTP